MKHASRITSMLLILALALMMCSAASAATVGETNALNMARELLPYVPLSYTGLIENLESMGFTHSEAVYAADNCGADWDASALSMARELLTYVPLSYTGLVANLESMGFTNSQAVHAADICFERTGSSPSAPAATATPAPSATPSPSDAGSSVESSAAHSFTGDFSGYSFSELKALQEALTSALWASEGWQQVTVPPGIYLVGRDIPAGHWTLTETGGIYSGKSYVYVYRELVDGELGSLLEYIPLDGTTNVILPENAYVKIEYKSVIFTPYVPGLGFVFE